MGTYLTNTWEWLEMGQNACHPSIQSRVSLVKGCRTYVFFVPARFQYMIGILLSLICLK